MDFLPGATAFAGSEMLLVIVAHFGGKTGNVIAPAGQDFAHDGIDALAHNTTDQPTAGLIAMLLPVPPIKPGYEGVSGGPPGPFRRPLSPLLGGCCSRKGAPIRCRLHFHHSPGRRNPRGPHWRGALRGSSPAA